MSFSSPITASPFGAAASAATLTFTTWTTSVDVGSVVILGWCANVSGLTVSTCADNSSQSGLANVYTVRTTLAGATFSAGTIYAVLTRSIQVTDTITITLSGVATRRAGQGVGFNASNGNAKLDKIGNVQNATTSPLTTSATGTLTATGDLGVNFAFWSGGAVASGWANTIAAWSSSTGGLSGGTTPRVESNFAYNQNISGTTSFTGGSTFTSITAGAGEVLTFTDLPQKLRQGVIVRRTRDGA